MGPDEDGSGITHACARIYARLENSQKDTPFDSDTDTKADEDEVEESNEEEEEEPEYEEGRRIYLTINLGW